MMGPMNSRPDRVRQTWRLSLDESRDVAELVPYSGPLWGAPNSFSVGAVERKLEFAPGLSRRQRVKAPLVGAIDVGRNHVSMTRTTVSLAYRVALRRNLFGLKRSGPLAFLGTLLGGSGLGGGAAAAAQTTLTWLIYALDVDGQPKGSWVAKTVDGVVERWIWVAPGGSLPDKQTLDFGPAR
jgi:hypothetical protein